MPREDVRSIWDLVLVAVVQGDSCHHRRIILLPLRLLSSVMNPMVVTGGKCPLDQTPPVRPKWRTAEKLKLFISANYVCGSSVHAATISDCTGTCAASKQLTKRHLIPFKRTRKTEEEDEIAAKTRTSISDAIWRQKEIFIGPGSVTAYEGITSL